MHRWAQNHRRGGPLGLATPIFSLSSLEPKSLRMVILIIILVPLIALSLDHQNHSKWHKWCHVRFNKAAAPTRTNCLRFFVISFSQFPNMLAKLRGFGIPQAAKTVAQPKHDIWQSKNKCCIVLFSWQKQHCWFPCQFLLARLSLVSVTPHLRNQR